MCFCLAPERRTQADVVLAYVWLKPHIQFLIYRVIVFLVPKYLTRSRNNFLMYQNFETIVHYVSQNNP